MANSATNFSSTTLMVCHSIGDTKTLINAAKYMINDLDSSVIILSIGEAASHYLKHFIENNTDKKINTNSQIYYIEDMLYPTLDATQSNNKKIQEIQEIQEIENGQFNPDQLAKLKKFFINTIGWDTIDYLLIGTPSKNNARTFLQIAELFANHPTIKQKAIINDYLFHEPEHTFWLTLTVLARASTELYWLFQYQLFVPINAVKNRIEELLITHKTQLSIHTIGHSIFYDNTIFSIADCLVARTALAVKPTQAFLFISGSKNQSDDISLLENIFNTIKQLTETEKANKANIVNDQSLTIRIGLHPGLSDINSYLSELEQLLVIQDQTTIIKTHYILTQAICNKAGIDINNSTNITEISNYKHAILANITGDLAAASADGIASYLPGSLANQAYLNQIPLYVAKYSEHAYLLQDLTSTITNLNDFIIKVSNKQPGAKPIIPGKPDTPVGQVLSLKLINN